MRLKTLTCVIFSIVATASIAVCVGSSSNASASDEVQRLQNHLLNRENVTEDEFKSYDLNNDGKVNAVDLSILKKKSSQAETTATTQTTITSTTSVQTTESSNQTTTTSTTQTTTTTTTTDTTTTTNTTSSSNEPGEADMLADFRKGPSPYFFASDGWTNGNPFDCGWYKENTSFDNNALNLTIDKDPSGKYNYSAAEYRTNDFYSYGYYETSMKAIKNDGVVSSFFTYTGPSDNNPWDEIDIEILGKDTTKVQFNYYTNGVGNHEYMYDLGFDASKGYHKFGFDWEKDSITWYVDGKEAYKATNNIPSTPGKIMMNVWPGIGVNSWLKAYDGTTPLTASYEWVTYKKTN